METTGLNEVAAFLEFEVNGEVIAVPLPHAPSGAIHLTHSAIAHVSGGQRLRRDI